MFVQATTVAAGSRAAISLLRFGPEMAANRSSGRPRVSVTTSSIRLPVVRSMPFIRETTMASPGIRSRNGSSATRAACAAMETMMISAPLTASARSPVAVMFSGRRSTLGRRTALW